MIRILAINSKYVHTLLSPYYLKENAGKYKCAIDIKQTNINNNIADILDMALEGDPIAVALPTYIFNVNIVEKVCLGIKQASPNTKIILGGPEVSYEYESAYPYADHIITGEGESAFASLVSSLIDGKEIPRVIIGEPLATEEIVSPYSEDYFRDTEGKIAYFEGSRGCPFSCAYCMSGGTKLRYFGLDRVFDELKKFEGRNIRVLKFVDRTFNANRDYAKSIMRYIIANSSKYDFGFHFEIAGDLIDDEFVDIVASSPVGLFQFEIGVQSFNERTLGAVIRKTDSEKVLRYVRKLIDTGKSHIHTDLISGLPYEDLASFKRGFDILYGVGSDMLQLGFLKVLKGSRLKAMLDEGYVYSQEPPYEIISTPYMSEGDIAELKAVEEVVDKYANSGLFSHTLIYAMSGSAYEFFLGLSEHNEAHIDLFERVAVLYRYLSQSYDKDIIKTLLTVDYLEHNNSRVLPPILKSDFDSDFKRVLRELGIDKKKCYAVCVPVHPETLQKDKCIIVARYEQGVGELQYIPYPREEV